jgi:gamma-glutamyltranspeptidase/glutathione hydrolase
MPQILMNLIDFGMDISSAIAAPRVSFSEPDSLDVEAAIPETIQQELRALGHKVRTRRAIGNAHGLTLEYDAAGRVSRVIGAADPRGAGLAKGPNPGPSPRQ